MPVSVIILAAGSSSRMGESKQLLPWKGKTLLTHSITTALESRAGKVYVVLAKDQKLVADLPVSVVINSVWERGIGSSIKAGLNEAKEDEAVLIMVGDMPFVTSQHLNNLIEHYAKTKSAVVASKYLETIGVPALFDKKVFDELLKIADDEGAKKVIMKNRPAVIFLESGDDIDTPEDYQKALAD
jgi:molybdenum cofactor cytidylyltransferase